jgi:hypothetical protein
MQAITGRIPPVDAGPSHSDGAPSTTSPVAQKLPSVSTAAAAVVCVDDDAEEVIDEDHGEGLHDYDDDDDDGDDMYPLESLSANDPRGLFMDGKDGTRQSTSEARGMGSPAFEAIPIPTSFSASVKVQPNSAESDANRMFVVQRIVRSSGGFRPFFQFQVYCAQLLLQPSVLTMAQCRQYLQGNSAEPWNPICFWHLCSPSTEKYRGLLHCMHAGRRECYGGVQ